MALTSLSGRVVLRPLGLADPMLRRVPSPEVTVVLALREACTVTLMTVSDELPGPGTHRGHVGTRSTARLGDHRHVGSVTASGRNLGDATQLSSDITLGPRGGRRHRASGRLSALAQRRRRRGANRRGGAEDPTPPDKRGLPSFVTPPVDVAALRIPRASCRKPRGHGRSPAGFTAAASGSRWARAPRSPTNAPRAPRGLTATASARPPGLAHRLGNGAPPTHGRVTRRLTARLQLTGA